MWDFLGLYWDKIIDLATLLVAVVGVFVGAGLFVRHKRDVRELIYVEQERDDFRKKNAQLTVRLSKIDPERFIDEINDLRKLGKFDATAERAEQFTDAQSEAIGLAAEVLVEQRILDSAEFGAGPLEEAVRFAEIGLAARPDDVRLQELSNEAKKRQQAAIDGEDFDTLPLDGMTDVDLNKLARKLHAEGKYTIAEICARRSVPLALARTGPKSLNFSGAISQHAETLRTLGDYNGAEPLYREALAVTEKRAGKGPCGLWQPPQQPRVIAARHRAAGRGRTVVSRVCAGV